MSLWLQNNKIIPPKLRSNAQHTTGQREHTASYRQIKEPSRHQPETQKPRRRADELRAGQSLQSRPEPAPGLQNTLHFRCAGAHPENVTTLTRRRAVPSAAGSPLDQFSVVVKLTTTDGRKTALCYSCRFRASSSHRRGPKPDLPPAMLTNDNRQSGPLHSCPKLGQLHRFRKLRRAARILTKTNRPL